MQWKGLKLAEKMTTDLILEGLNATLKISL